MAARKSKPSRKASARKIAKKKPGVKKKAARNKAATNKDAAAASPALSPDGEIDLNDDFSVEDEWDADNFDVDGYEDGDPYDDF